MRSPHVFQRSAEKTTAQSGKSIVSCTSVADTGKRREAINNAISSFLSPPSMMRVQHRWERAAEDNRITSGCCVAGGSQLRGPRQQCCHTYRNSNVMENTGIYGDVSRISLSPRGNTVRHSKTARRDATAGTMNAKHLSLTHDNVLSARLLRPEQLLAHDKVDFKHMYTEATFATGSEFIRHALVDSESVADLRGNKKRIPFLQGGVDGRSPREPAGMTRPGIEPGSPWWEASKLTAQPPWPRVRLKFALVYLCCEPSRGSLPATVRPGTSAGRECFPTVRDPAAGSKIAPGTRSCICARGQGRGVPDGHARPILPDEHAICPSPTPYVVPGRPPATRATPDTGVGIRRHPTFEVLPDALRPVAPSWLGTRSEIGSKIDTEDCCAIRVQSWTGDRYEVNFEPPKLAVPNLDPRSAAIVVKCSLKIRQQVELPRIIRSRIGEDVGATRHYFSRTPLIRPKIRTSGLPAMAVTVQLSGTVMVGAAADEWKFSLRREQSLHSDVPELHRRHTNRDELWFRHDGAPAMEVFVVLVAKQFNTATRKLVCAASEIALPYIHSMLEVTEIPVKSTDIKAENQFNVGSWRLVVRSQRDRSTSSLVDVAGWLVHRSPSKTAWVRFPTELRIGFSRDTSLPPHAFPYILSTLHTRVSFLCHAGATVAEWLVCSPPTKVIRVQCTAGSLQIFSGISHFPRLFRSGAALRSNVMFDEWAGDTSTPPALLRRVHEPPQAMKSSRMESLLANSATEVVAGRGGGGGLAPLQVVRVGATHKRNPEHTSSDRRLSTQANNFLLPFSCPPPPRALEDSNPSSVRRHRRRRHKFQTRRTWRGLIYGPPPPLFSLHVATWLRELLFSPVGRIDYRCVEQRHSSASCKQSLTKWGRGGRAVSPLASHLGEPGLIPGRVTGFSHVGIVAGRCRWSAGFLGDLPFPPPFHSGAATYSPQSPSSAFKALLSCLRGGNNTQYSVHVLKLSNAVHRLRMANAMRRPFTAQKARSQILRAALPVGRAHVSGPTNPSSHTLNNPLPNIPARERGGSKAVTSPFLKEFTAPRRMLGYLILQTNSSLDSTEQQILSKELRNRSRSEGAIRATLTRTSSASSPLRAKRAVFPSCYRTVQFLLRREQHIGRGTSWLVCRLHLLSVTHGSFLCQPYSRRWFRPTRSVYEAPRSTANFPRWRVPPDRRLRPYSLECFQNGEGGWGGDTASRAVAR
ncbi:hypothetical protein PR048_026306 [Dryococelus australis]|uniref:Uncharacterized protein n=1 Tax=Dryococelus australis TaxID=614101 RepID=A0ABQ9GL05_9NEOP|nr:hypothetical protein PR048_026306 [Dryococelus australis]